MDWREDDVADVLANPIYAVSISPTLCGAEPIIERELWIDANASAIREMGPEAWLGRLLDVLGRGGQEGSSPSAPAGSPQRQRRLRPLRKATNPMDQ